MANPLVFPIDSLRAAVCELMRGFGSQPTEVERVTENLLQANLTGHDSHGIDMLPRYAEAFREGWLQPNAHVEIRRDSGAMLSLDGRAGFGQVIGHEAMQIGIARAKQHGCCILALGNAHHLGRIGAWAEMAVAEGLISVHFVNVISRPIVAPWGGSDARLGTNPFAAGIPVEGGSPSCSTLPPASSRKARRGWRTTKASAYCQGRCSTTRAYPQPILSTAWS